MATVSKLEITYEKEGGSTMDVTVSNPKDDLDLEAVKTAAANGIGVFEDSTGLAATAVQSARLVTTSTTELA